MTENKLPTTEEEVVRIVSEIKFKAITTFHEAKEEHTGYSPELLKGKNWHRLRCKYCTYEVELHTDGLTAVGIMHATNFRTEATDTTEKCVIGRAWRVQFNSSIERKHSDP